MLCKKCGSMMPENAKFCTVCGSKLESASVVIPVQPPVNTMNGNLGWGKAQDLDQSTAPAPSAPVWEDNYGSEPTTVLNEAYSGPRCPRCGNVMYAGATSCASCGWSAGNPGAEAKPRPVANPGRASAAPAHYSSAAKPAASGKTIGLIAGAAAALLVIIVLVIGVATNWFGLTGPAVTIATAVQKTLTADNFTVEFNIDMGSDTAEGVAYVDVNLDEREITALLEMEVDGEAGELAIYDGYAIVHSEDYWEYVDISDMLDEYFDAYEQTGSAQMDWEEMLDEFSTGMYDEISEYVDFDALNECLKTYVKKLNSKSWLKENAGYSTAKEDGATVHRFEPDTYKFATASIAMLEPAVIDPEDYETLMENLESEEDTLDEIAVELAFAVKGGKLVGLDLVLDVDGEEVGVELDFSDIGKTELDVEELEDMLDKAIRNS